MIRFILISFFFPVSQHLEKKFNLMRDQFNFFNFYYLLLLIYSNDSKSLFKFFHCSILFMQILLLDSIIKENFIEDVLIIYSKKYLIDFLDFGFLKLVDHP